MVQQTKYTKNTHSLLLLIRCVAAVCRAFALALRLLVLQQHARERFVITLVQKDLEVVNGLVERRALHALSCSLLGELVARGFFFHCSTQTFNSNRNEP